VQIDGKVVTTGKQEKDLKEMMLTNLQLARSLATTNLAALRNVAEVCARGDGLAQPGALVASSSTHIAAAPASAGRVDVKMEETASGSANTRSQPAMPGLLAAAGLIGPGPGGDTPAANVRGHRQQ
jgi:hypothetical protein